MNKTSNKIKKNKNNSNSKFIALLFGILGISLIIGLIIISFLQKNSISSYFVENTALSSEKIYTNLLELTEENYPKSPEDVVTLYAESYKLLYGGRIKENYIDLLVPTILEKQRILFSDELLNENPIDFQLENVKNNIKFMLDNKLKITTIETSSVVYDKQSLNNVYIYVTISDNTVLDEELNLSTNYNYKYYLEKGIDDKWRITSFYLDN